MDAGSYVVLALAALGIALLVLLWTRLAARPTWRARFDPPGDVREGRDSRIDLWRRA
jgi:hypothetical protein